MLKFFRRIRQELLTEGHLKKYLVYALGEIFLVVIGILIALQINSWSTEHQDRIREREYLSLLAKELKKDIVYFTDLKDGFRDKEVSLKRIIRSWQKDTLFLTDSLQYINDFKIAGDIGPWYIEPVIWTQLIQTGDLKLIQNQHLIDALFSYYSLVKRRADNYSLFPMEINNQFRAIDTRPFKNKDPDSWFVKKFEDVPDKDVYDWIWANRADYLELFENIAYSSHANSLNMQGIIDEGRLILELLESE